MINVTDFDFEIVNFPFLDGDVPRSTSYGYNINVLQQTSCLVVNPIMVGNFAFLFNCTPVGRTSDSMMVSDLKTYLLMRW